MYNNISIDSFTESDTDESNTSSMYTKEVTDNKILEEIYEEIYELSDKYIINNLWKYYNDDFIETAIDNILNEFVTNYEYNKELCVDLLLNVWITNIINCIFIYYKIPKRQVFDHSGETDWEKKDITEIINRLNSVEYPAQRTKLWYLSRYKLFSASNLWKVFGSVAVYNSLIYEKSKPLDINALDTNAIDTNALDTNALDTNNRDTNNRDTNNRDTNALDSQNNDIKYIKLQQPHTVNQPPQYGPSNSSSSCALGIKYEQLSLMIYKHKHPKTEIKSDYGCIEHLNYPFIGASPDAINIGRGCAAKYGRLIEVKNIINREITGIPKFEYWIQMQIQMETCNLPLCDFLETRIKEYENEHSFYADLMSEYKGIILYFVPNDVRQHMSHFEYMPLYVKLDKESITSWINATITIFPTHYCETITYWYLDEYSCVTVERNMPWFDSVIDKIEAAWTDVLNDRQTGNYHLRAPKKIEKKNKCLIKNIDD